MNTYSSVVPSEMTNRELLNICTEIQTAKNWGLNKVKVLLSNGQEYHVPTSRHKDYQSQFKTIV